MPLPQTDSEATPMKNTLILTAAILFLLSIFAAAQQKGKPMSDQERWNQRYDRDMYIYGKEPAAFLKQKIGVLKKGKALVLAMGEGRNAVYLAQNGFDVTGVDISDIAIEKCKKLAAERGTKVNTVVADLTQYDMGEKQFDLITNFYYYDTSIFPKVIAALKPGGMFILETFSTDHPKTGSKYGPKNPDYLVKPNELLEIFRPLRILYYEDTVVDLNEGMHNGPAALIRLIAKKPE
jgi:tellurite methyltransferase